jgi:hypothetical protein
MKKKISFIKNMLLHLPDNTIDNIFSFYNPYKLFYNSVITELNSKYFFKICMKQLQRYSLYDKNKNFISFQKDSILYHL